MSDVNQISMQKHEDPVTLFEQLAKVSNQFNTVIDKEDAIAILMDVAPLKYQSVLNAKQIQRKFYHDSRFGRCNGSTMEEFV